MKNETKIKSFHLKVQTKIESLRKVLQWFEQISKAFLPESIGWQCQLALAEGFTNVVCHAHQDLAETTTINLEVNLFPSFLEIKIWDWGKYFDLESQLKLSQEQPPHYLEAESGRGLYLMQKLTDEIEYISLADRCNCLVMRKKIT